jgi:hypothetical protein
MEGLVQLSGFVSLVGTDSGYKRPFEAEPGHVHPGTGVLEEVGRGSQS